MNIKVLRIVGLLAIVVQLLHSCLAAETGGQVIESEVTKLEKSVDKDAYGDRIKILTRWHGKDFPAPVLEFYSRQLRIGNAEVVRDIANVSGLWSESFASPLIEILVNVDRWSVRSNVLAAFDRHRSLSPFEHAAIFKRLNASGQFSIARLRKDHLQIALAGRLGHTAVLPVLGELLDCSESVPHPIGLSQPLGRTIPPLRVCDCAHDAIVGICRGNLDARIALAYENLNLTNRFDPRLLHSPVASREVVAVEKLGVDEPIDHRQRDERLYNEVLKVRDEMIRALIEDMIAKGVR